MVSPLATYFNHFRRKYRNCQLSIVNCQFARMCAKQLFILPAADKEKEEDSKAFLLHFPALVSLGGQDLTAIVVTASLASSVGLDGLAALGADGYAGSGQLPVGAAALIATGLGHFTLRDSHGDTSLVKLLFTAFVLIISEAASKQQVGDRSPSGKCKPLHSGSCRSGSTNPCSPRCTAAWNPDSERKPF